MEIGSQWERRSEQKGLGLVTCPGKVELWQQDPNISWAPVCAQFSA